MSTGQIHDLHRLYRHLSKPVFFRIGTLTVKNISEVNCLLSGAYPRTLQAVENLGVEDVDLDTDALDIFTNIHHFTNLKSLGFAEVKGVPHRRLPLPTATEIATAKKSCDCGQAWFKQIIDVGNEEDICNTKFWLWSKGEFRLSRLDSIRREITKLLRRIGEPNGNCPEE